mgnify:CR=1 FL=1
MLLQRHSPLALLNDTHVLSHTRGVRLIDLLKLVGVIHKNAPNEVSVNTLITEGKLLDIPGFREVLPQKPVPTRVRHHWYALEQLELVPKSEGSHKNSRYCLSLVGKEIAESSDLISYDNLGALPSRTLALLRKAVASSRYVNKVWLSFLRGSSDQVPDRFILEKVSSRDFCQQIVDLRVFQKDTWRDSGYRVYPSSEYDLWRSMCLTSSETNSNEAPGFILSDTARKEIVAGVRKWCSEELEITTEIPGNFPANKSDCVDICLDIRLVQERLPSNEMPIELLTEVVRGMIRELGVASRISIPKLVAALIERFGISLSNAKGILEYIYHRHSDQFYYEGVSRAILRELKVPRHEDYYLWVGGAWRANVRLW